jgi:pyridoxal phosphate enzyme (YggS family)
VSIADRLSQVRARIERAARDAGRDPAGIRLVAVSKTRGFDDVREAFAAGQRAFGENYAQELAAKAEALGDLAGIEWHFIGHLQTNKARIAAKHAHVVHTVDSAALARELGKRAAREARAERLPVLIEVNVAHEPQKSGATPSEIEEVMREVSAHDALALRGLMTVPPAGDALAARRCFEALVSLRNLHGGASVLPELSMGMSEDLEIAIACGATIVRVGTAIFGARHPR